MSAPLPTGYTPPDHRRPADLVMADLTAYGLLVTIGQLYEDLIAKLDHDVQVAAQGAADPASGFVTGSKEHDQMDARAHAIRQAEAERTRQRKNALEELRRVIQNYEIRLGRRPPPRARVETINYLDGGTRRVG